MPCFAFEYFASSSEPSLEQKKKTLFDRASLSARPAPRSEPIICSQSPGSISGKLDWRSKIVLALPSMNLSMRRCRTDFEKTAISGCSSKKRMNSFSASMQKNRCGKYFKVCRGKLFHGQETARRACGRGHRLGHGFHEGRNQPPEGQTGQKKPQGTAKHPRSSGFG